MKNKIEELRKRLKELCFEKQSLENEIYEVEQRIIKLQNDYKTKND